MESLVSRSLFTYFTNAMMSDVQEEDAFFDADNAEFVQALSEIDFKKVAQLSIEARDAVLQEGNNGNNSAFTSTSANVSAEQALSKDVKKDFQE